MQNLTIEQKILRWASQNKVRKMAHLTRELSASESTVMKYIRKVKRAGLITYNRIGQKVELSLTQIAYYNRAYLVK